MKADSSGTLSEQQRAQIGWLTPVGRQLRHGRGVRRCAQCLHLEFTQTGYRCALIGAATKGGASCDRWEALR